MRGIRFTFLEWHYTGATENLFDLTPEEYHWYKLIVKNAP
jgi:hypothetical protein